MFSAYQDKNGIRHKTSFTTPGELIGFIAEHPEYTGFSIFSYEGKAATHISSLSFPKERRSIARAEVLFHGKSFVESMKKPPVIILPKGELKEKEDLLAERRACHLPYDTPWYIFDSSMRRLSDEEIRKKHLEDEKAYNERLKKNGRDNDVVAVRDLSDSAAAEEAEKLLDCSDSFWGDIASEAVVGPSLETLYLYFGTTIWDGRFPRDYKDKYKNVTYISTDESLPITITGWNIRLILQNLQAYVFKPFNAVANGKVLTLAPVIPAFTEAQARHILKKRLYQSSAAVLDGKVIYCKGLCTGLDENFPYHELSLEEGFGLKYEKLPDIDSLEIERSFTGVELQHFFRSPFCRSMESMYFTDNTYTKYIPHPALSGDGRPDKNLPGHCNRIAQTEDVYYPYMNFFFVHMFAEELGLKPVIDDLFFKKEEALSFPFMMRTSDAEVQKRRTIEWQKRYGRYCELLVEEYEKDAAVRKQQLEKERDSYVESLLKDAEMIEKGYIPSGSEKAYSEALKRYVSSVGLDSLSLTRGSSAYNRLLEFILYTPSENDKYCTDLTSIPNYYLLKALAYFYFNGPRTVKSMLEEAGEYPKKNFFASADDDLNRDTFCYMMSFLNPLFDIKAVETEEYRKIREEGGFVSAEWDKNCRMNEFIKGLMNYAESYLDYFALHFRDSSFQSLFNACNLHWLSSLDKADSDTAISTKLKETLLDTRRKNASFMKPENCSKNAEAMLKEIRRRRKMKLKSYSSLGEKLSAKMKGREDERLWAITRDGLVNICLTEKRMMNNEKFGFVLEKFGFHGTGINSRQETAVDWLYRVFPDWDKL